MLRLVNSNRLAAVAVLAAAALLAVTLVTRFGGRSQPAEASTEVGGSTTHSSESPPAHEDQSAARAPERLSIPLDPTGSRSLRSLEGARQAAIDFASTVQQRLLYLTPEAGRRVLASWASTSASQEGIDAAIDDLAELRTALTDGSGQVWWSVSPIAVDVEAFDAERARVSVWCSQIVASDVDPAAGGQAIAPTIDFHVTTVDLIWNEPDGWSVWNAASSPGPVPMMSTTSTMSSPIEFMDALGHFTLIKEHS